MDKNRALNENVCSILLFLMNTIKSLSPFTDQEYAHSCNILYCLVCLVLKMEMSVLCEKVDILVKFCEFIKMNSHATIHKARKFKPLYQTANRIFRLNP